MIHFDLPAGAGRAALAFTILLAAGCPFAPHLLGDGNGGAGADRDAGGDAPATPCRNDAECPPPSSVCASFACVAGLCAARLAPAGSTHIAVEIPHDCRRLVCDGDGGILNEPDDNDTPDDENPCTVDTCQDGGMEFSPRASGESVAGCTGDSACDGEKHCRKVAFTACSADDQCISGACYKIDAQGGLCKRAPGEPCTSAEECYSNVQGPDGRCAPCDAATNCGNGYECVSGKCLRRCPLGNVQCALGYTCTGDICFDDCNAVSCPKPATCKNRICIP